LLEECESAFRAPNSWNFDFPHFQIESADTSAHRAQLAAKLTGMMADTGYEFEITGLQRRYLMYMTDGSVESQKKFERLMPGPDPFPFRRDGTLKRPYTNVYDSQMRDAKVPFPKEFANRYGSLRPCLYFGPAWVVRFKLDGQDTLLDRCRVYVTDNGDFICSDWCQRHDFSSYTGGGINLQMGIYNFSTWITGPCVAKAMESGHFKPKHMTVQRSKVRELVSKAPPVIPTLGEALGKATALVAKYTPAKVEVGEITAAALEEALAAANAIVEQKIAESKAKCPPEPVELMTVPLPLERFALVPATTGQYVDGASHYVVEQQRLQNVMLHWTDSAGEAMAALEPTLVVASLLESLQNPAAKAPTLALLRDECVRLHTMGGERTRWDEGFLLNGDQWMSIGEVRLRDDGQYEAPAIRSKGDAVDTPENGWQRDTLNALPYTNVPVAG
jgi:hypothetical protein